MKRVLTVALLVLVCVICLTSCSKIEQEVGKAVSVAAVEAVADELDKQGVTYEFADEQALAEAEQELAQALEQPLQGDMTAALFGETTNEQTGDWVRYWTFGFSTVADAEACAQYASEQYKTEIEQGKAIVINGGYIVNITVSSIEIQQD